MTLSQTRQHGKEAEVPPNRVYTSVPGCRQRVEVHLSAGRAYDLQYAVTAMHHSAINDCQCSCAGLRDSPVSIELICSL